MNALTLRCKISGFYLLSMASLFFPLLATLPYQWMTMVIPTALLIIVSGLVLIEKHLMHPIKTAHTALDDIKDKGFLITNVEDSRDDLQRLTGSIQSIGSALEGFEATVMEEHSKKMADYTSHVNEQVRNLAVIQNSLSQIRSAMYDIFATVNEERQDEYPEVLDTVSETLMNTVFLVDELIILLKKNELPVVRRLPVEPIKNLVSSIEQAVEILSKRKRLDIELSIDNTLTESNDFMIVDLNVCTRLLVIAFEYWPNKLEARGARWHMHVDIHHRTNKPSCFRISLTCKNVSLAALQWQDIKVGITKPEEERNPLNKMMYNLLSNHGIRQSVSMDSSSSATISYQCFYVAGDNKKELAERFKKGYHAHLQLILVGSNKFIEDLEEALAPLYIDYQAFDYDSMTVDKVSEHTGMVIVDCVSDILKASRLLKALYGSRSHLSPIRVGLIDQIRDPNWPNLKETLESDYYVDHVMFSPPDPFTLLRLANGRHSSRIASKMLQSILPDSLPEHLQDDVEEDFNLPKKAKNRLQKKS